MRKMITMDKNVRQGRVMSKKEGNRMKSEVRDSNRKWKMVGRGTEGRRSTDRNRG